MIFNPEVSLGDIISAASFLVAALALFLTLRRAIVSSRAGLTASALTAQLGTLIQIQAMPEEKRAAAWTAIASSPGGPGAESPIEKAIAIQIQYLDLIAHGKEIPSIPTYGRK